MSEAQGLSLADIANLGEEVEVGDGKKATVKGISAKGCLLLLIRFPDLQKWLTGKSVSVGDIVIQAPEAIAGIIAAGMGQPGDSEAEELASNLPVEMQTDMVEAIYRQTFRSGFGPFALQLMRLYDAAVLSVNSGAASDMKSPQELKPLSPPDIPPKPSGTTPPA